MKPSITSLLILGFLLASKTFACSCKTKSLAERQKWETENSECIFIGEVLEINESDWTFKIKVIESLDGGDKKGNVYIGKNLKYCSPYVSETGKWMVYGNIEKGFLRLNSCGISRSFQNPTTLTADHIPPPPPKVAKDKIDFDNTREDYLAKAKKDLELEIIAVREELDKKNQVRKNNQE